MNSVRREVQTAYKRLGNWRAVGAALGITGAMAYRIGEDGYEPKEPAIRVKLGLPAMVPAPACPKCGRVHVTRRCTAGMHRSPRDLWEMDVEALREALIHRVEM